MHRDYSCADEFGYGLDLVLVLVSLESHPAKR